MGHGSEKFIQDYALDTQKEVKSMSRDRAIQMGRRRLLNIDACNEHAITLFNPYGESSEADLPTHQGYRSSRQRDQSRRSKLSHKKGNSSSRQSKYHPAL